MCSVYLEVLASELDRQRRSDTARFPSEFREASYDRILVLERSFRIISFTARKHNRETIRETLFCPELFVRTRNPISHAFSP